MPGEGQDETADKALSVFDKFPEWMWRNTEVRDFLTRLREWNTSRPEGAVRAGFYGMDLYSLFRSRDAVLRDLAQVDPIRG